MTEAIPLVILLIVGGCFTAMTAGAWSAWIGLIPIILAVRVLSPKSAAVAGAFWGGSIFFFATALPGSSAALSYADCLLIIAAPTIYTFLMSCYRRHFGFSPLAMALGWLTLEWIVKTAGMSAMLHAADVGLGPVFEVISDFLGYGFVAFIVAYVNAVLLSLPWRIGIVADIRHASIIGGNKRHLILHQDRYRFCSFYQQPSHPRAPPAYTR